MANLVYLNNKYIPFKDAKIPIEDRGFQFSDSVYEVVKIINKKILDEVNIAEAGYCLAVTEDDEVNVLASLLA